MMTQETTSVKTWGGFNLAILKVKSKSTRKNRSSYNKTYKPLCSTSYCYPPVELTDTTCASSESTDSFFLGFSSKYKHPRLCFFKLLWQQLNDHQALERISFLIILSLREGKSSQISQEIHTNSNMSNLKNMTKVCLLYLGKNIKPQTF